MSPLLRLPRELRDQIYVTVLYDADGLLYKKDKDGFTIWDENGDPIKIGEIFTKEIRKKIRQDNTYLIKEFGATTELTKWDGNAKNIRSKIRSE